MPRSQKQQEAWKRNKAAFKNDARVLSVPNYEVHVPHVHRIVGEGSTIHIYVRIPLHASASIPVPYILQVFSLDDRRTQLMHYADPHLA